LNLGCFGCCGRNFAGKTILKRDIRINTKRYYETKHGIEKLKDISKKVRKSGLCKFVMYLEEKNIGCPLHPSQNEGQDLRKDHCDIDYLCTTQKLFANWDKERQNKFIEYLQNRNLDFVDYSRGMANGSLLIGFKRRFMSES
jgi:hypothetical protein